MNLKQAVVMAVNRPLLIAFFVLLSVHVVFSFTAGVKMWDAGYDGAKVITFQEYEALIAKSPKQALEPLDKVVIFGMPYSAMVLVYIGYLTVAAVIAVRIQKNMSGTEKKPLSMTEKRAITARVLQQHRIKRQNENT